MIGGLLFSYNASPHFDAYVLEFRLFADLINDVGLTLDMMAPLVPPSWLLMLMSASTLSKTMCGMSAGATKSSITCHLALEGNMADLNAKEGTQETLVSLLGMILGIQLAKFLERLQRAYSETPLTHYYDQPVPVEVAVSWSIFMFLTWLHMWANYRGVKLLKLKSLNRERARAALETTVAAMAEDYWANPEDPSNQMNWEKIDIPSPDHIEESMIRATATLLFPRLQSIALGMPLLEILQSNHHPSQLVQQFQQERYIIGINNQDQKVLATLRTGADNHDELKAFLHCLLLRKCLDMGGKAKFSTPEEIANLIQM
jgi:Vitamin B6 photo-protection and homoeostasis